jgi:WD40 repeat protein
MNKKNSIKATLAIAFGLLCTGCGKAGGDKAKAEKAELDLQVVENVKMEQERTDKQAGQGPQVVENVKREEERTDTHAELALHATLKGHANIIRVGFSPDGKTIATEAMDRSIKLWDTATGHERAVLPRQIGAGGVAEGTVHFSPDSGTLATAGFRANTITVKLWNVATGQERATLRGQSRVQSVVFSSNGKTVAMAGLKDTITLRDAATGQERATLKTRELPRDIYPLVSKHAVILSPDGKTLLTAEKDGAIKLWEVATGRERTTLQGAIKDLLNAAFSPDGKVLVTLGGKKDRTVKLWDVATGQERATLKTPTNNHGFIFSPDSKTLATFLAPYKDYKLKLWDVATAKEMRTLEHVIDWQFSPDGKSLIAGAKLLDVATGEVRAELEGNRSVFTPDRKTLATASEADSTVKLRNAASGEVRDTIKLNWQAKQHISMAFSPDGKTLLTYRPEPESNVGTVQLWDVATTHERPALKGQFKSWKFSPDGKALAMQMLPDAVQLCDVATGKVRATLEKAGAVGFSPDGKTLATAEAFDSKVKLWDVATGQLRGTLAAARSDVVFNPDSTTVTAAVMVGDDRGMKLWDVATGKELAMFKGVDSVVFSPNSNTLVAVGSQGTVETWDAATGKELAALKARPGNVSGLVILSPDGKTLVTKETYDKHSQNSACKLWDVATGKELATFTQLDRPELIFSPDGKTLLTTGKDGTITFWEAATGQERATLQGSIKDSLSKAVFSPDGKILATITIDGNDRTVKLWDVATGQERATLGTPNNKFFHGVIFSPDSKTLAMQGNETVKLWEVATGKERTTLNGMGADFSPDGKTLVTANAKRDGSKLWESKLWEVATGKERATLSGQGLMAFSPDSSLVATSDGEVVRVWHLSRKK